MITFAEALLATMTKEELAAEVVRLAKENVKLKNKAFDLEYENFWILVKQQHEHQ